MRTLQLLLREGSREAAVAQEIAYGLAQVGFDVLSVGTAAITLRGEPGLLTALMHFAAAAGVLAPELKANLLGSADEAGQVDTATSNEIRKALSAVESVDQPPRHELH